MSFTPTCIPVELSRVVTTEQVINAAKAIVARHGGNSAGFELIETAGKWKGATAYYLGQLAYSAEECVQVIPDSATPGLETHFRKGQHYRRLCVVPQLWGHTAKFHQIDHRRATAYAEYFAKELVEELERALA